MRKLAFLAFFLASLLNSANMRGADDLAAMAERARVRHDMTPHKVLAFYYPWYGNPAVKGGSGRASHWGDSDEANKRLSNCEHFPTLGLYDSYDPNLIAQHCTWARQAGIDAFVVSWWSHESFEDRALGPLLDQCQAAGLEVTVYYETVPLPATPASAADDIVRLLRRYADHPAWLRLDGQPVLFVYSRAVDQLGLVGWAEAITRVNHEYQGGAAFIGDRLSRSAARVFDGIHTYNTAEGLAGKVAKEARTWADANYPAWVEMAETARRVSTITVIPGYDDTKVRQPGFSVPRGEGELYQTQWEAALAARPDWVLVTSFNEWHEGSEIEPSVEQGKHYLKLTAQYAPRFKQLALSSRRSDAAPAPITAEEAAALRERLAGIRVGLLPGYESPAVWALLGFGTELASVSWDDMATSDGVSAKVFPMLVYAMGEEYRQTVSQPGDVDAGIARYLKSGGLLMVLPSQPMPFYYNEGHEAVDRADTFGLPLSAGGQDGGWERPPAGTRLAFSQVAGKLPHLPATLPFPATGDLRWRPFVRARAAEDDVVAPLLELKDADGRHYGDAAAYIEHRGSPPAGGKVLYAWFGTLDSAYGEALVYDLLSFAAGRLEASHH